MFNIIKRLFEYSPATLGNMALKIIKNQIKIIWFDRLRLPALGYGLKKNYDLEGLMNGIDERWFFEEEKSGKIISKIEKWNPGFRKNIIMDADRICNNEVDLLGSGPRKLGLPIEWANDWIHGKTWPKTFKAAMSPLCFADGGDVKVPWELSRFYHMPVLGQAYLMTKDERYPQEFKAKISHWEKENPIYRSPSWGNAMEASIRLSNLLLAWSFLRKSPSLTSEFHSRFINLCYRHAQFIYRNLERGVITGNHYLADLIGLIYFGLMLPELPQAKKWADFSLRELEKETLRQFNLDGPNFEGSTCYHRLTTEIISSAAIIAKINHIKFSKKFWDRLEKAFDFILACSKSDQTTPQIGDNDDGRIHLLDGYFDWGKNDHTFLLAQAAFLFPDRKDFSYYVEKHPGRTWLTNRLGNIEVSKIEEKKKSTRFERSGYYVLRVEENYCLVSGLNRGVAAPSGHFHNDLLGFELEMGGDTIFVDPGTYVYTSEPKMRDLFRSTKMHNTVQVDNVELQNIPSHNLFGLGDPGTVTCLDWKTEEGKVAVVLEHDAYARLTGEIRHKRSFTLSKDSLIIEDAFSGKGKHRFEWFFHLGGGWSASKVDGGVALRKGEKNYLMEILGVENIKISEGWSSPSYGVKIPSVIIRLGIMSDLSDSRKFITKIS